MLTEVAEVQNFANSQLFDAQAGFSSESSSPALATPTIATPSIVIYVVQGSTICLVC